jgi:hypothetical protein
MKKLIVSVTILAVSTLVAAQETTGKLHCDKPANQQMVQVPGQEHHIFMVQEIKCSYTEGGQIGDQKFKDYAAAEFVEAMGNHTQNTSYGVVTAESGDKAYVRVRGRSTTADGKLISGEGTYVFVGGTGKMKSIRGKGTFKMTGNDDGTADVTVSGTTELPTK